MPRKSGIDNRKQSMDDTAMAVLRELVKNPVRSLRAIASAVGIGKQKCWRKKKMLEESNAIWGYSAVVNLEKIGWKIFIILSNITPLTPEIAEVLIKRAREFSRGSGDIVVIDSYFTAGVYDGVTIFAAKNAVAAKRYYDTLRLLFKEIYVGKPVLLEVMFTAMMGGKVNPEIERLHELVPDVSVVEKAR